MKQQINLYKGRLRRERVPFGVAAMSACLAACALCMVGGWWLASNHATAIDSQLEVIRKQETAAAARLEELNAMLTSRQSDNGEARTLNEALEALARRERLLELIAGNAVGATAGFSTPLRALAEHGLTGLWLTRITVSAPDLRTTLEGRATSPGLVPEYLLGLSAQGVLSGQRFDQFEIERLEDDKQQGVRFSMTSEVAERFAQEMATP